MGDINKSVSGSKNVNKLERHQILGANGKTMVYVYDGLDVNYRPTKGFTNYSYYIDSNGKRWKTRAYNQWTSMTSRCNSRGAYQVNQPTYVGVTTSEEFADYDKWCSWAENKVGFMTVDENGRLWQLDKDLLATGNLHYSRDTVCFLPASVNSRLGSFAKAEHKLKEKMFKDVYDEYFHVFDDEVLEAFFGLSKFDFTLSKSDRITLEEHNKILESKERTRTFYGKVSNMLNNTTEEIGAAINFKNGMYVVNTSCCGVRFNNSYKCIKEASLAKVNFKIERIKTIIEEIEIPVELSEENFHDKFLQILDHFENQKYQLENGLMKLKQWVQIDIQ